MPHPEPEDQEEGEVGCGPVEHAGCVAHRDAVRGRGADVDVVVAHGHVRDDAQLPTARARVEHLGIDAIGEQRDDRVDFCRIRDQFVVRVRHVVGLRTDELVTVERCETAVR